MFVSSAQFKIENLHGCLTNLDFKASKCEMMRAGATVVHLIHRMCADVFSHMSLYINTPGIIVTPK